jgi:regulator of replication initiation timing
MKGKILLAIMLLAFVLTVAVSHAQPPSNFKYTVYTPDGLKPGAKIAINVELDTKKSDAVFVFVKIFAFPVYADSGEDFEYLGLVLGEQYVDAYQTGANALKQYAYQGVLTQSTTYGFAILPKLRLPGKYTGNITLTVPGDATCGETLFMFFLVSADDNVTKFIMPVGLVCEEEFRQGIYYESSVSSLNDKIQSLMDTVGSLNNQLQSCTAKSKDLEKQVDVLNSQLQEKDKKIATLEATLNETQSELATLQNKEKFYESGFYVLTVLLLLAVLVSITVFFVKKEKH